MRQRSVLFILLICSISAFAQNPTYQYRLMNDLQVSSTVYEFDIYLKRTGGTPLEVANTQVGLNFNGAIRNGGTLTFSLVAGTSDFLASQVPSAFSVDNTNNILRIQARTNPGSGNGTIIADTGIGTRFGRFRITDTAPFGSFTPDLSWNFISTGGRFPSRLSAYVATIATDITVQDSHKVSLANPILNTSISGHVYNDLNGNGAIDGGEPGLQNWRIRLSQTGTQIDSVLTDGNGNYGFPALAPGTYTITEQVQAGWALTSTPSSYTIVVTSGSFSANNNFGNFQLGSIDGMKFNDVDGDGVKDAGETGLSGWRIRLSKDGTPVDSALTDGSGLYAFANLTAGSYTVSEVVQTGWLQTFPLSPGTYAVSIMSGSTSTARDFGNFQYGSISGQKFNDLNGNGAKDIGEAGLSGWKIILGGPVSGSVFTDGSGNYSFSNLTAGSYTISESLYGNWIQSYPSGAGTHTLTIVGGSVFANRDFGNVLPGSISGMAFHDENGNGAKDGSETGLSTWRIRLSKAGIPVDSSLTDGSGNYAFVGLLPGTYTVSEEVKSGWIRTAPASPGTYTIPISSGSAETGRDFGNFQLGSIAGTAYHDLDGDGAKDVGEPGLSSWRIRLAKDGTPLDSVLTDVNGNYVFTGLVVGTYTVSEATPTGWIVTNPVPSGTHTILITSGTVASAQDFGNFQLGSISGRKFIDLVANGVRDSVDPGLSGWRIRLSRNGSPADSVLTDANGNYAFSGLALGSYAVSEAIQANWYQSTPPSPGTYTVNITSSGSSTPELNFGNYQYGSISGVVFDDLNGNGVRDGGEPGLNNWRVRLHGVRSDSMLTDVSGNYSFASLVPGSYSVSQDVQNGWIQTLPPSQGIYLLTVTSGAAEVGKSFGNFQATGIAGVVFNDMNADGVKDAGEPGLPGWRIRLTRDGAPIDSALTDSAGAYLFTSLLAGTYVVSEVQQAGWTQSLPTSPGTYTVVITSGSSASARDFGNYQSSSVQGIVFLDLNGNGSRDTNDVPITGRRIRLAGPHVDSLLTDPAGAYLFANLRPGNYTISEALPAGWVATFPPPPGSHTLTLTSGLNVTGKDFGNFQLGSISGLKFNDLNGNGVRDSNDTPLVSWNIELMKSPSERETLATNILGEYAFTNVGPGQYLVSELLQPGWVQTAPSSPGTYSVTMTSGGVMGERDFGNFHFGSISGLKFNDLNANGRKDSTEPGLAGWKIKISGPKIDSTLCDSAGRYAISALPAGEYLVVEEQQAGWTQTYPLPSLQYALSILSGTNHTDIDFGNTIQSVFFGSMQNRWNIVSVPVVPDNGDLRNTALFPTATSAAFGFAGQYVVEDTLLPGRGYWLKFDSAQIVSGTGVERLSDTIAVNDGWNLIGALSRPIASNTIVSDPGSVIESRFFGFGNQYYEADTIRPFYGYWVKMSQAGNLYLSATGAFTKNIAGLNATVNPGIASSGSEFFDRLNHLEVIDGQGTARKLYFMASDTPQKLSGFELPPSPPAGTFDARFSSNRKLEIYPMGGKGAHSFEITVQAETGPVTVRWNIAQDLDLIYQLYEEAGGKILQRVDLRTSSKIELSRTSGSRLVLTVKAELEIPAEYILDQNYPNPFNPVTQIRYGVPEKSHVRLNVFNVLGQKVETLVDAIEEAGYHRKQWQPSVASGTYFYILEATSVTDPGRVFTETKKMVLVR